MHVSLLQDSSEGFTHQHRCQRGKWLPTFIWPWSYFVTRHFEKLMFQSEACRLSSFLMLTEHSLPFYYRTAKPKLTHGRAICAHYFHGFLMLGDNNQYARVTMKSIYCHYMQPRKHQLFSHSHLRPLWPLVRQADSTFWPCTPAPSLVWLFPLPEFTSGPSPFPVSGQLRLLSP